MEWEADPFGAGEYEYDEYEYETYPEMYGEAEGEMYGEYGFEGPFDEAEEMELAAQLLEITDEGELDQFLGNLFKKVSRTVGRVIRSPVGRQLGGILKGVARRALPIAGRAIGTYFGGPAGGAIGGRLASTAGRLFGLELEGMSVEDQEFEVARRYVRLAGDAAQRAAAAPSGVSPQAVAQQAIAAAAQKHAPGLAAGDAPVPARPARPRSQSGRWVRRGRKIILLGV
jgi:hypothetical protein